MKNNNVLWICALLMLTVGMSSCGSDDRVMGTGQTSPASTDSNTDKWLTQDQAWQIVKEKILQGDQGDRSLIFYFERGRDSGVKATSVFSSG